MLRFARIKPALALFATVAVTGLSSLSAQAADLIVSGAASLTNAFRDLGPMFEAQNPGTKVMFNFAASDALLQQITQGAPVDVFATADEETMDKAEQRKLLVAGSRHGFVRNALTLIVPSDSTLPIRGVNDLTGAAVKRVAIGAPAGVPAGRYTKEALEKAGLWAAVEPKAVYAQSVRQSLDYVARGETEAGFVYATDAAVMKDKVKVVTQVPTTTPISYPIAQINGSPNPAAAQKFLQFLNTAEAQAVLARYGFQKP
jgi:molybdate transport system substrate-binding protein